MSVSAATKQAGTTLTRPRKAWILLAVSLGQFLIQLDLTIVNVALPAIGRDLSTSVSGLQWVVDAYSLALASLLLAGGQAGDRSGHKRVYLVGVVVFSLGSALCAVAPTAGALAAFRVLQGIGAAIELPATLAILSHTFSEPRERAQAVGIWTSTAGSALIIGPVLGGALVAAFGWRSVFLVNLPVTAAIALLVTRTLRETPRSAGSGLDVPGQLLGSAALALLSGGAIEGGKHGFSAALPLGLLAGGAACVAAFIGAERRPEHPVLPLRFFRSAAYCAANAAGVVMGFVVIGLLFLFALYFQQVQGESAMAAGLRFVPLTAAFVLAGPLVGRVIDRTGHRGPMTAGCVLLAAGSLLLLRVGPDSGYGPVWWPFVIAGVGYGLLSTPMAAAVLGGVPRERAGMASSTNLTARLVGGVFGVAVLGALMSAAALTPAGGSGDAAQVLTHGLHAALVAAAAVALAGAVLTAVFIPGRSRTGGTV